LKVTKMKSEALNIQDKTFLVNRLIQQAPTGTLIREFFKNADENAALAAPNNRRIEIYPTIVDGVRKLTFWNTGIGMDEDELKLATDLSSSINKPMSLNENFGIGAKVSGLTMSKQGIRYRSCKNGRVHEVTIGYEDELGTYARFATELPDGTVETVYDVTEAINSETTPIDSDWTEVVLFGESDDHDTVLEPIGKGIRVDRSFVATAIFRRFAKFSDNVEVRIDVAMTKGGGKEETGRNRQLKTLDQILDRLPKHEKISDLESGVSILYVHDPKHEGSGHSLSARANAATASTAFCALLYKGERYDFKTGKSWSAAAPNFGIPFGSRILTVEISVDDDLALPNQYRDGLTWPSDRSPMNAEDFSDFVREFMPGWVKDIIKAESPEATENLDDLQADLQKLLDEFRVPTITKSRSKKIGAEITEPHGEGISESELSDLKDVVFPEDLLLDPQGNSIDNKYAKREERKKIRKAPEGSQASATSKALEQVPEIQILIDPDEINEKQLKGRAGRFYKDAQTLFVNGLYPVSNRMADELIRELTGEGEPEQVREAALNASRRFMAFRVGKATCYAISKKIAEDWNMDDLDKATSPESLSMAADDYKQSLSAARKWAKIQIKASQLSDSAAA